MFTSPIGLLRKGEATNTNKLHALTYHNTSYEMIGIKTGEGVLTTVHADPLYIQDVDDVFQRFPANAPVWKGGRVALSGGAGSDVTAVYANTSGGVLLPEIPRLWQFPTARNYVNYSNDLTQGGVNNWALTSITVAQDIPGLTGEANTGCTLTDSDILTNGVIRGGVASPDINHNVAVYYIGKDTNQTRFVGLLHTYIYATSTLQVSLNTETGASAIYLDNGATNSYEVVDLGICWQVLVRVPNENQNTPNAARIYPSFSTILGGAPDVTLTDSCAVLQVELHLNTTIEKVKNLGPIFTTTGDVAKSATVYTLSQDNHNETASAYSFELDWNMTGAFDNTNANGKVITFGSIGAYFAVNNVAGNFKINDSTTDLETTAIASGINKCAVVYNSGESLMSIALEEVWSTDTAFDGTMDETGDIILGQDIDYAYGIREIRNFDISSLANGKSLVTTPQGVFPVVTGIEVLADQPNAVRITFDEPVSAVDYSIGMSLTVAGSDNPVNLGRRADVSTEVLLYTEKVVKTGDVVTLDYNEATGSYISESTFNPLQDITSQSATNNAFTYDHMLTQIDSYPTPPAGFFDFSIYTQPRIMHAESGQNTGIPEEWYRQQIQTAQAIGLRNLYNIDQSAKAETPPHEMTFFRMYTPIHSFMFLYPDKDGEYGGTQGHNMPAKNLGPSTHWSFRYGTPGAATGFPSGTVYDPDGKTAYPRDSTIFPGHYVYHVGDTLTTEGGAAYLAIGGDSFTVPNPDRYAVGSYVCIRDAIDDWTNADHRKITAKSGDILTIGASVPDQYDGFAHQDQSYIAPHGYSSSYANWAYNMSTECPYDAPINESPEDPWVPNRAGKQLWELMADFLATNVNFDLNGSYYPLTVNGLLYDVDREYEFTHSNLRDFNNDGIADGGISDTGVNWFGAGMSAHYAKVRTYFPNWAIVGGTRHAMDSDNIPSVMSGTQEEAFFAGFKESTPVADRYIDVSAWLATYLLRCHTDTPTMESTLVKVGNTLYPIKDPNTTLPVSDTRLSFGGILLDDGWFHHQKESTFPEQTHYDEYSVDVVHNSPTYGYAVDPASATWQEMIAGRGWLGKAVGAYYRIYDITKADSGNLLSNGDFIADLTGWTVDSGVATLIRDTGDKPVGATASMKIVDNSYGTSNYSNSITSCLVSSASASGLDFPGEYTICFEAKTSKRRYMDVGLGWRRSMLLLDTEWHKYALTYDTVATSLDVRFYMGRYSGDVWVGNVKILPGSSDVYRRDYENGIVLFNGGITAVTIPLEANYLRIQGTARQIPHSPGVNTGDLLSTGEVIVPARDAVLLVRTDQ